MEGKEEYIFLKKENERLLDENQKLRIENAELKDKIQKYETHLFDPGVKQGAIIPNFIESDKVYWGIIS